MIEIVNSVIAGLNPMGQTFWANAAQLFVQSAVLIVLLLILDFFLQKRVRAVFRYGLWMLLLVKLLLPVSFSLPTSVGYWLGDYFTPEAVTTQSMPQGAETVSPVVERSAGPVPLEVAPPLEAAPLPELSLAKVQIEAVDWQGLVFLAWLGGMLVLLAFFVQRAFFVKGLVAKSRAADRHMLSMLDNCCGRIGIQESVELRLSDQMHSPALCGLFRPTILLPKVLLERLSPEKLETVLMHELAHVKRADVWVNLLQTLFQIVYFYNPFIWVANAMIRRAREQAVDEMVLVTLKSETKQYSHTLLDIAEMMLWRPSFSVGLIGVVESKRALERRIKHMLNRPIPKRSNLGTCGFMAIAVIGLVCLPMGRNFARERAAHIPPTSTINGEGHIVDKTDYPFVNDAAVIGGWKSVDSVRNIGDFDPAEKNWKGDLFLNHLVFEAGGRIAGNFMTWTKGLVLSGDTASKYIIKEMDGAKYLFFEWKSGDYTIRHMRPHYFVLKQVLAESLRYEPLFGKKALIPPTSRINEQGHIVDKVDYPFVNDPAVIGTWKSVDHVDEIKEFKAGKQRGQGRGDDLFLKTMTFAGNGTVVAKNDKAPDGYTMKWTKGLVLSDGRTKKASEYTLKDMDGSTYMFYQWKSGDYTFRYKRPSYYVLKKVSSDTGKAEPRPTRKAHIPPTSTINAQGRIVDKLDYPFVNDPKLIGTWKSVDLVREMKHFKAGRKSWRGDLYLKELIFLPQGRTFKPWWTWTKGMVFHAGDKTASEYTIKDLAGSTYMFYQWKSGDYTIRHRKPAYYVLKKVSPDTGGLAEAWASQPSDAEFARLLPGRIEQLNIDTADLKQVKAIFGPPAEYIWGEETFTEDNLPRHYILLYPSEFRIFMVEGEIVELRHESGSTYVFRDTLRCGSTLDEVIAVLGPPRETVVGQKNSFGDGVLYKDIDGEKGYCYYARSDQNVRLWFSDYTLIAIYMTCSDYYTWITPRKGYLGIELSDKRWPVVNVIPDMPAAQAGMQNGDKILKINEEDVSQITTIRGALAALKGDPGDKVKLIVQRGEQTLEFEVEMTGQLPAREL